MQNVLAFSSIIVAALSAVFTAIAALASWKTVLQVKSNTLPCLKVVHTEALTSQETKCHLVVSNIGGGISTFAQYIIFSDDMYSEGVLKGFIMNGEQVIRELNFTNKHNIVGVIVVCDDAANLQHACSSDGRHKVFKKRYISSTMKPGLMNIAKKMYPNVNFENKQFIASM